MSEEVTNFDLNAEREALLNIGAALMAKQIRKAIEQKAGRFSDDNANWILDEVERLRSESEGRRKTLFEKSEEVRSEWTRAEKAEAEVKRLQELFLNGTLGDWPKER